MSTQLVALRKDRTTSIAYVKNQAGVLDSIFASSREKSLTYVLAQKIEFGQVYVVENFKRE